MAEYLQVWKARVDEANVERLLELRPAAIAEAQRLCPELLARRARPPGGRHLARRAALEPCRW
jgi:hypothetical protein